MSLFFQPDRSSNVLAGEEARHGAKVLRLAPGDKIEVTDGLGSVSIGIIKKIGTQQIEFDRVKTTEFAQPDFRLHMAVCPTRKAERNEWMVEKMMELGVQAIHFIVSDYTHHETLKRVLNLERLQRITLAAMKQSRQYFLPEIRIIASLDDYMKQILTPERYIAYVAEVQSSPHLIACLEKGKSSTILIGPEGDFSGREIGLALENGFVPVSLGPTRLRTETAAVVACHAAHLAQID